MDDFVVCLVCGYVWCIGGSMLSVVYDYKCPRCQSINHVEEGVINCSVIEGEQDYV